MRPNNFRPISRYSLSLLFFILISLSHAALAQTPAPALDPSRLTVERIFAGRDFQPQGFGGFKWLKDGNTYARVGSSRVDLQACKLEYSIVSPK